MRTDLLEDWSYTVHSGSGAIWIRLDTDADVGSAMASAQQVAYELDAGRAWFRWEDLDEEEQTGPLVIDEVVTAINGVRAIGPGGRIRLLRQTHGQLVEIVVRPRISTIPSNWRPLGPIVDSVNEAAADQVGTRVRFAFGYHEASSYEEQRWLRPVYVFLIEQESGDALAHRAGRARDRHQRATTGRRARERPRPLSMRTSLNHKKADPR